MISAGGKAGAVKKCNVCDGRGIKVTIRQIGPGMVQQMQSACNICSGKGMYINIYSYGCKDMVMIVRIYLWL